MEKEVYEAPKTEIIWFETEDVITTSTGSTIGEVDLPFNW